MVNPAPQNTTRTFPVTVHVQLPQGKTATTMQATRIELITPTGQVVWIEPDDAGDALNVRNPYGTLKHSLRPADPPEPDDSAAKC